MDTPPVGLLAAIHADYIQPNRWVAWADRQIGHTKEPPMWLIDLSLARDTSAAWNAISESIHDTPELPLRELDEIALGLIALKYFEGEIEFSTFLHRAGDHTDPSSCSTDCEYFYHHLNRYLSAPSPRDYEDRAAPEIRQYLKEAIDLAQVAKAQIKPVTEQAGGHQKPTRPEST